MFLTQGIYDLDELARFNLHIHTNFSGCAKDEMSFQNIISTAQKAGLQMIALCDHIYEPEDLPEFIESCNNLRKLRDELNPDIKVLIGGEFSCYASDTYTLKGIELDTEYRLYAQNHFHVTGWEQPAEKTPENYKELTKVMLRNLFKDKAADTIAHPLNGKYLTKSTGWSNEAVGSCWSDNEIGDILTEAYNSECAFELNTVAVMADAPLARRMFNIGKEIGAVFTLGTDAHRLDSIDPKNFLDDIKRILL